LDKIPYFTHKRMINWIDEAGRSLGFQVQTERRQKTHGKIFQIDSTWFKDSKLVAFVEAERRWDINHIIGHLVCCADFASQERNKPYFILVFLENASNHSNRLDSVWRWLKRFVPDTLKVRGPPIFIKKEYERVGLHASKVTIKGFTNEIRQLVNT
jgi:hypothetical protein